MLGVSWIHGVVWGLLISSAGLAPTLSKVSVKGPFQESLRKALKAELGDGQVATESDDDATVFCWVDRSTNELSLELVDKHMGRIVRRTIEVLDGDDSAALRAVVVLIAQYLEDGAHRDATSPLNQSGAHFMDPEDESTRTGGSSMGLTRTPFRARVTEHAVAHSHESASRSPWTLRVGLGMTMDLWSNPATLRLGPALELSVGYSRWLFGLEGHMGGAFCCRSEADIEFDGRALALLGRLGYRMIRVGPVEFLGEAGLGIHRLSGTARARTFAAPGTVENVSLFQGTAQLGCTLELELIGPLRWTFAVGLSLTFGPRTIRLPEPFAKSEPAFDTGLITPWASTRLVTRLW